MVRNNCDYYCSQSVEVEEEWEMLAHSQPFRSRCGSFTDEEIPKVKWKVFQGTFLKKVSDFLHWTLISRIHYATVCAIRKAFPCPLGWMVFAMSQKANII